MARTTSELVSGIIEVDDNISLVPFIETANELVTEILGDSDLGDTRLEKIERYLAAHFYCLRDPRATSERAGPVSQTLQRKTGCYFSSSHYGETAMLLDTTGALAALNQGMENQRIVATVDWVGTDEDDD